jgi:large repetitive protein
MSFPANFVSGSIFVKAANACGETKESRINVTGLTRTPGAISGQTTLVCANTSQSYSIAPVAGATSYQWSATGDISLQSENGTEATFNFGSSFASGTIEVQAVNACGASAVRRLTVRSNVPARPGIISGLTAGLCPNESSEYSINPVANASNYIWTFTGDLEVTAGQGSTSATYTAGTGFLTGQVSVQAQNVCGISSARVLNVRSTPALPGSIAGPGPDVPKGTEGLTYSINPVASATGYIWTTTNGLILASESGTSAEVDIPADFNRGAVQVRAVNACGEGSIRIRSLRGLDALPFAGSRKPASSLEVDLFPNPSSGLIYVRVSGVSQEDKVWLSVYDLSGKYLLSKEWTGYLEDNQAIDLTAYPAAMYLVQIMTGNEVITEKVVKQ